MSAGFTLRLRSSVIVGVVIALGIVAMDIVRGNWDALVLSNMLTLGFTVVVAAVIWAWLTGLWQSKPPSDDNA